LDNKGCDTLSGSIGHIGNCDIHYDNNSDNNEIWTLEKLKDELFCHLMSIKINGKYKYDKQARDLIYRISIYKPTPYFIINYSDLSLKLTKELSSLDNDTLDEVIRDVISWIYESINKNFFLLSIKIYGLIFWEIKA
jgi:hypothetical protein